MKKIAALFLVTVLCAAALLTTGNASGSASGAPDAYKALHALSEAQMSAAEYLLANAADPAPEVSNEPVTAEYEDGGVSLWFDHSYYNTPPRKRLRTAKTRIR